MARQILANPQWAVRQNVRIRRTVLMEEAARYQGLTERFDWTNSSEARDAVAKLSARSSDNA